MPGDSNGIVYAMYRDLAYAQSIYLLRGFWKPPTGSDEALFNRQMSSVQITVEWGFADVVKFLDFCSEMKIFKMPVVEFYTNGAFLRNICNCLYGNKTQHYFGAVQLMLDENLDLIVEKTSDKTETTINNDVSMLI